MNTGSCRRHFRSLSKSTALVLKDWCHFALHWSYSRSSWSILLHRFYLWSMGLFSFSFTHLIISWFVHWQLCLFLWRPSGWDSLRMPPHRMSENWFHGFNWMVSGYLFFVVFHKIWRCHSHEPIRVFSKPCWAICPQFLGPDAYCDPILLWCSNWLHHTFHWWWCISRATPLYWSIPEPHR